MKKSYQNIFLILLILVGFSACQDPLSKGVSKITYYPIITLTGDQWMRVTKGQTWTDPGVKAEEGGAQIDVQISGDEINTAVPGVYVRTYTAVNKDGFSATQNRYIGVIDPAAEGIDLTGKYKRTAGALGVSTVIKIAENLYTTDNVGGIAAPGPATTVHFYHYAPGKLAVPPQTVNGSVFYCTNATVIPGVSYSWVVINSGYGTALRTFVKQ